MLDRSDQHLRDYERRSSETLDQFSRTCEKALSSFHQDILALLADFKQGHAVLLDAFSSNCRQVMERTREDLLESRSTFKESLIEGAEAWYGKVSDDLDDDHRKLSEITRGVSETVTRSVNS